jgi:hypothetical protein
MKEKFSIIWAFISHQEEIVKGIIKKIGKLQPLTEDKMVHLAYQLHNLYSSYEDLFKEIAITFENNIKRDTGYHKHLLTRMKISIPGIRPGILSEKSHTILIELMGFRHVFRHAYDYNLSAEKLKILKEKVLHHYPDLESDIRKFKEFLEEKIKE